MSFRHQDYVHVPQADAYRQVLPQLVDSESDGFRSAIAEAGQVFSNQGVTRIILVHGTMAGTDALGWYGHWQRLLPRLSSKLKATYKSIVDRISGDRGNYSAEYASRLASSLNHTLTEAESIQVERFHWTSENHHLGRADAAVRLANLLLDYYLAGESVLLWGHSHAGNVFAIVSNLLGEGLERNPKLIQRFFDVRQRFASSSRRIAVPEWQKLEDRITNHEHDIVRQHKLRIATFGTPIRYGWDLSAIQWLVHIVNHHPVENVEPYRSVWPGSAKDFAAVIKGEYGDFVQLTFITGSDLPPAIWSQSAWKANRDLQGLLEPKITWKKRKHLLSQALRVANSGRTLLVDYAEVDPAAKEICGHAVYTELEWMAFHAKEIAKLVA